MGNQGGAILENLTEVHWHGRTIRYCTTDPNALWRAQTLFSKEPSTIKWLCKIQEGETLLDVGANVGMYSLFAAACRGANVYAFEPESQNYALLNKNIHINKLDHKITAYCLACSDKTGFAPLYLSEFKTGSSCHSLGEEVDFNLRPRSSAFQQGSYAITIDEAVQSGAIPTPDHIKLDVDGFEHKVLLGASEILCNPKVRSLIVEINPTLDEHIEIIFALSALGFSHDEHQVHYAARKQGPFEGVGEWIFTRTAESERPVVRHAPRPIFLRLEERAEEKVRNHVLDRIRSTSAEGRQFPISVIDNIFPDDYYQRILDNFPSDHQLVPLNKTGRAIGASYKNRLVAPLTEEGLTNLTAEQRQFWRELGSWLYQPIFMEGVIDHLGPYTGPRLAQIQDQQGEPPLVRGDALLVSDRSDYAIGPHTDAPHRLISFLFYLPIDESKSHLGTSLYKPKQTGMVCAGGVHHKHDQFDLIETIDYLPNRLVLFPKTDSSFHGVEPITDSDPQRHLLISNIRLMNPQQPLGLGQQQNEIDRALKHTDTTTHIYP